MEDLKTGLRGVAGLVLGYAAMGLLITLVQEVLFDGVGYYESGLVELGVAGFLTVLSAAAGGLLAAWVAGRWGLGVAAVMALLVVAETTTLALQGVLDGPLWFDVLAAAGLIGGIVAGAWWHHAGRTGGRERGTSALHPEAA